MLRVKGALGGKQSQIYLAIHCQLLGLMTLKNSLDLTVLKIKGLQKVFG
jgi:hypothetical protein